MLELGLQRGSKNGSELVRTKRGRGGYGCTNHNHGGQRSV